MNKQYRSIDVFKFICAVLIIILHTAPFASYSKMLSFGFRNIVTTIAVPFFFVSSGFITREKSDYQTDYIKKYTVRLFKMYLVWSAVYLPFVIIKWAYSDFSHMDILEYIKDFFFEGSYQTIWFLPALLTATVLVWALHKKFSYLQIFLISLPVYVFTLAGSSYYGLAIKIPVVKTVFDAYYNFFDTIKNGLLFGLAYVSLGALISEKKDSIKLKMSSLTILIIVFYILLAVEELGVAYFRWNSRGVDTVIMHIPLSFFIFAFLLKLDLPENTLYVKMRKYSLLMFLCQRIPLSVIGLWLNNTVIATNSMMFFIVVFLATMLISWLIIKLSEKFKVLKILY